MDDFILFFDSNILLPAFVILVIACCVTHLYFLNFYSAFPLHLFPSAKAGCFLLFINPRLKPWVINTADLYGFRPKHFFKFVLLLVHYLFRGNISINPRLKPWVKKPRAYVALAEVLLYIFA